MEKINTGIIGMGFIAGRHADAVRRVPYARIAAVSHYRRDALEAAMKENCVEKGYLDWRELIADPGIQVIHNCAPNHLHDEINRAALEAGKHVYSEKPLSLSSDTAGELWKLAESKGLAHGVNYQYRMNAAVQEMKARVSTGEHGRQLLIRGHYLQESHALKTDYSKRLIPETSPARAIADIGSHWADTVCCITGKRIESVYAEMITHHPMRKDPVTGKEVEIKSDDTTSVLLHLEDGTPGIFLASKVACGHKNDLNVTLNGELCEYSWNQQVPDRLYIGRRESANGELFMSSKTALPEAVPYITTPAGHAMGWPEALMNSIRMFYDSIMDGTYLEQPMPYATFEDGMYANMFIDACIESSRKKDWVKLGWTENK